MAARQKPNASNASKMPDDLPYDVFLSHSAQDKAVVRPLAERLRQDGLKLWLDEPKSRDARMIAAGGDCKQLVGSG